MICFALVGRYHPLILLPSRSLVDLRASDDVDSRGVRIDCDCDCDYAVNVCPNGGGGGDDDDDASKSAVNASVSEIVSASLVTAYWCSRPHGSSGSTPSSWSAILIAHAHDANACVSVGHGSSYVAVIESVSGVNDVDDARSDAVSAIVNDDDPHDANGRDRGHGGRDEASDEIDDDENHGEMTNKRYDCHYSYPY